VDSGTLGGARRSVINLIKKNKEQSGRELTGGAE